MQNEVLVGDWWGMWGMWGMPETSNIPESHELCVYKVLETKVKVGKKSWPVSDALWMDKDEFLERAWYIGKGKPKGCRRFIPFVKDRICPFSDPKQTY